MKKLKDLISIYNNFRQYTQNMTDKRIKQEQWSVKELMCRIDCNEINKPKFQRKRKWDKKYVSDKTPNEREYIDFLFKTENSVHPITLAQEGQSLIYTNIDGNNRINALKHFNDKPFELYPELLDELFKLLDNFNLKEDDRIVLKNIFSNLSYREIVNFKYNVYFKEHSYDDLYSRIKIYRDDTEEVFEENIQKRLKLRNIDDFDTNVKINVNIFQGYTTDEMCATFQDINKYNSRLTENELLASQLCNQNHFEIKNQIVKSEIEEGVKEYYNKKAIDEVLPCFIYNPTTCKINAYDFIVGFQISCSNKYSFIERPEYDGSSGVSLFFKLYKLLMESYNSNKFTTDNVNKFIDYINYACVTFNNVILKIFNSKINDKLFNKTCKEKVKLTKNNMCVLLSSIFGYKINNESPNKIQKSIEQCLLFHFLVGDIKTTEKRDEFKNYDYITYKAGGGVIENGSKSLLSNPHLISSKLDKEVFKKLMSHLISELNNPHERKLENGKYRNYKRRNLRFFEKMVMFYYYKERVPVNMLNREFSIEHFIPNSSEWTGLLDKDRTGNLFPIISSINSSRGNRQINEYYKTDHGKVFFNYIKDIIPSVERYDSIVTHTTKKPIIINNELYNKMCEENEEKYMQNFINCVFN
jgi:hypothetical protein